MSKCYKVEKIPGKGFGMIAIQNIAYGQLIIEEKPALDTSLNICIHDQFDALSENMKEQVMALHSVYEEDEKLTGIMKTNCFSQGDNNGVILCIEMSRFNHSCMPNVATTFVEGRERAVAVQNIEKGEELCISYSLLTSSISETRKELRSKFQFDCNCRLCSSKDPNAFEVIEQNRILYGKLDDSLDRTGHGNHKERLQKIRQIFSAMEAGKLYFPVLIARYAFDGFQAALLDKNRMEAKRYIDHAYEANLIAEGKDSETTKEFLKLSRSPEQYKLFRGWSQ